MKLSNLKQRTFDVTLAYADGTPLLYDEDQQPIRSVRLGSLSWIEWHEAAMNETLPTPPKVKKLVNGKQTTTEDRDDPQYKHDLLTYNERITLRRLALSMSKPGSDFCEEMAPLRQEQRVDLLMEADRAVIEALVEALIIHVRGARATMTTKEEVREEAAEAAATFHGVSGDGGADTDPLAADAGGVAGAERSR